MAGNAGVLLLPWCIPREIPLSKKVLSHLGCSIQMGSELQTLKCGSSQDEHRGGVADPVAQEDKDKESESS